MTHTKERLIQLLIPGLIKSTGSTAAEVRGTLETYSDIAILERELARQKRAGLINVQDIANDEAILRQVETIRAEVRREYENNPERIRQQQQQAVEDAEVYRDYYLTQIFRLNIRGLGVTIRNDASERLVISWLHPGENLNIEWFLSVIHDPRLSSQLQWQSEDVLDPQKIKQAEAVQSEQDRKTFSQAARQFQLSDNIANFNLARQTLGEGFSVYQVQHIDGLSPASQQEIDNWNAEAVTERQDFLRNRATISQLKAASRDESVARQQATQQEQAARQLDAQQQRDQTMGFPKIPSDITRKRILAATPSEIKYWGKRYGQFQLNQVIAQKEPS